MASRFGDDNGEMEEETLHKKRARRVSFAETTAVHFFNRDEDCETTPDAANDGQNSSTGELQRAESEEMLELLQTGIDDDLYGGDEDAEVPMNKSFLRPIESPSSGSCFGSATSIDEDHFFGPVSAEFIRPGRLSDSALSDENHEVTMDSSAFSMNFLSLAKSDFGGEFKTPTRIRAAFGERTPNQTSTATSLGDLMVLTGGRKQISRSSSAVDKLNDSGNSDDMSLVGENVRSYDYGKLPPELDVLLVEDNQNVEAVSLNIECSNSMSTKKSENDCAFVKGNLFGLTDIRDAVPCDIGDLSKTSSEAIAMDNIIFLEGNDVSADAETTRNHSNDVDGDPGSGTPSNNEVQATDLQTCEIPFDKDKFKSPPSSTTSNLHHQQPIAGSISSLLPKRRQIFKDLGGLQNPHLNSAQFDEEFPDKGAINRAWSASFFAKSVSRLRRLEPSFLSASKVEGNASRCEVAGFALRSMKKENKLENGSKDISLSQVDAPVACLDERFAEYDKQSKRASEIDNYGLSKLGILERASLVEVGKDEEFVGWDKSLPSQKSLAKDLVLSSSTSSPEARLVNFELKDNVEAEKEWHAIETVQTSRSDSSLQDITFNDLKDSTDTGIPGDFACLNGVVSKVSSSPLFQGSPSMLNLVHQGLKEAAELTSTVENCSTLIFKKKAKSKLSSSDINLVEDVLHEQFMHKDGFSLPINSPCSETALKDKFSESCKLISSSDDIENGRTLTSPRALPVQRMQSTSGSTLSSDARPNETLVQVLENPKVEPVCSMLPKEPCDVSKNAKVNLSEGEGDTTPYELISKDNDDAQISGKSSNIRGCDGPSSLKRKLFDKTEGYNDHSVLLHRKPKLRKDQNGEEQCGVSHCIENDSALRVRAEVFSSFCGMTNQLLTPMNDKFDVALISKLDDVLVHLDKLKSYEVLHHEKSIDSASFLNSKRVAETKFLLYRTVYQKAKLQLLRLKRDKFLDQASRMKSRVDKSEILMSSCHYIHKRGEIDQSSGLQPKSRHTDTDDRILVSAEISSLRKEIKDFDSEIQKINQSFCSYVKDMTKLTATETAAFVKGVLEKMVACQSLQSELQLCKVERLEAMIGQPNILLDHGGFMLQSFITKSTAASGLLISNRLNNEKISKMFFNSTDVYTAFSFVVSGDMQLSYEGLRTIAEQMQKAGSLLHTILDVIEEVELARQEVNCLTRSRFCQPSAGKLDLHLDFTDFNYGARVTMSLDITCLNRGVYPSAVLPYEVRGITARDHDKFESLVADIRTAVQGVRCGYMRIISICRCVSRMIQAGGAS